MLTKGFTLLETLFVLSVSTLFILIFPAFSFDKNQSDVELFESTVIHTQFLSLYTHQGKKVVDDTIHPYPIEFNALANTHYAQTINIYNLKTSVISLGTGKLYEKS